MAGLSDGELLKVLIGSTRWSGDALADELIPSLGGLGAIRDADFATLCGIPGVGPAIAARLMAAVELGRRVLEARNEGGKLSSSEKVFNYFFPRLLAEKVEVFMCALLDSRLHLMSAREISRGTLTASVVHPREAFKYAVRSAASSVIFVHNHQSGDPSPSEEDVRITRRLIEAGDVLGIPVLDHVIIGAGLSYFSFADSRDIEFSGRAAYKGMVLR